MRYRQEDHIIKLWLALIPCYWDNIINQSDSKPGDFDQWETSNDMSILHIIVVCIRFYNYQLSIFWYDDDKTEIRSNQTWQ